MYFKLKSNLVQKRAKNLKTILNVHVKTQLYKVAYKAIKGPVAPVLVRSYVYY